MKTMKLGPTSPFFDAELLKLGMFGRPLLKLSWILWSKLVPNKSLVAKFSDFRCSPK
jgi:hypothetical protein